MQKYALHTGTVSEMGEICLEPLPNTPQKTL